ncbi:hypothetical protein J6590_045618 [Homalodisca vitripennis]|nr:hypothetical protein J6590_045618 [Homalodisca vitripennis]
MDQLYKFETLTSKKATAVKSIGKAFGTTKIAIVSLPTALARKVVEMGLNSHILSDLPCETRKSFRYWAFGLYAPDCKRADRSECCLWCGVNEHTRKAYKIQFSIDVEILSEQYRKKQNLRAWIPDATGRAVIWVYGQIFIQEISQTLKAGFSWVRVEGTYRKEFLVILSNLGEDARSKHFNARAVKCVSRETNRRGDSILYLVSCVGHGVEQYTYSNHQAITFHVVGQQRWRTELQQTLARWNVRSFDLVSFGIVMEENVQVGINAEQMASSLM